MMKNTISKGYLIKWHGGMFDMIIKSKKYRDLEAKYEDRTTYFIRKKHLKENIIPLLNELLNEIIKDNHNKGFKVRMIDFNYSKVNHECYISYTLVGDRDVYSDSYISNSFDDIKVKLMDMIITRMNIVTSIEDMNFIFD